MSPVDTSSVEALLLARGVPVDDVPALISALALAGASTLAGLARLDQAALTDLGIVNPVHRIALLAIRRDLLLEAVAVPALFQSVVAQSPVLIDDDDDAAAASVSDAAPTRHAPSHVNKIARRPPTRLSVASSSPSAAAATSASELKAKRAADKAALARGVCAFGSFCEDDR